jgi:hypothetical protein
MQAALPALSLLYELLGFRLRPSPFLMRKGFARWFGDWREQRVRETQDSVLGPLRLAEEDWWEATVATPNGDVGFKIGGKFEPDAALLAHARDIVHGFTEFEQMVARFLEEEAAHNTRMAAEIRQLAIEDVNLWWPKRPNDGMIYFKGPDPYRVWRCDYVLRKPRHLGFDS